MANPNYRFGEIVVPPLIAANGNKVVFQGLEHLRERGGALGRALPPVGHVDQLSDQLRRAMESLLYRVQEEYPHPPGAYWVPRRLGGSAPSPEVFKKSRAAELLERVREHEKRRPTSKHDPCGPRL